MRRAAPHRPDRSGQTRESQSPLLIIGQIGAAIGGFLDGGLNGGSSTALAGRRVPVFDDGGNIGSIAAGFVGFVIVGSLIVRVVSTSR